MLRILFYKYHKFILLKQSKWKMKIDNKMKLRQLVCFHQKCVCVCVQIMTKWQRYFQPNIHIRRHMTSMMLSLVFGVPGIRNAYVWIPYRNILGNAKIMRWCCARHYRWDPFMLGNKVSQIKWTPWLMNGLHPNEFK